MIGHFIPSLGQFEYVCEWIIRIVMLFVVPLRRAPAATRSWLLLIFFLPIPGLLLFLTIGRPRFPRWRTIRFRRLTPYFEELTRSLETVTRNGPIAALGHRLGGMPAVSGNAVEFIDDYGAVIDRLVEDIDRAERHVRLLVYIFAHDESGRRVIEALRRAVSRGVACHVLVDPIGSHRWVRDVIKALRAAGVEVHETLGFHLIRARTRRDMRNHRKLFLIDGRIGYAGSQNIVNRSHRRSIVNRELVVRATGPVVAEMNAVFLADWYLETEQMLEPRITVPATTGEAALQLLPSGASYPLEGFETILIWQIHEARERVVITTPYLVPDEDLLGAMRTAVARGVEINLVVSAIADQMLVSLAQRSYYDDLLNAGIRIHAYRGYLLHAKNVSVDGLLGIVGSSNVDLRSFQLNEEVSLLLYDAPSIARLEAIQQDYLDKSDEIHLAEWRKRPMIRKLGENIARLIGPLL